MRSTRCWSREALTGRDVVRLKGGDPFIFGRGGEEAEAVPRGGRARRSRPRHQRRARRGGGGADPADPPRPVRSIVSFVAGQCKGLTEQDWAGLAGKGRTLVIYMGVKTAPQIAEKLMGDGLAPDVPVAVIENASAAADARAARLARRPARLVERERGQEPGADRDRRRHRASR